MAKTATRRLKSLGSRGHGDAAVNQAGGRRTLVVHIGTHKTATTSFQEMVAQNQQRFPLLYPLAGRVGSAHHNIAWELMDDERFHRGAGTLAGLGRELRAARASAALISSEFFALLYDRPDRLAKLRAAIVASGYRPHIVVTLRDPVSYLESLYTVLRNGGMPVEFDRFVANAVARGGVRWRREDYQLDYVQLVAGFAAIFGAQAVTTVRYNADDAIAPLIAAIGSASNVRLTAIEGWPRLNTRDDTAPPEDVRSRRTMSGEQRTAVRAAFLNQFEALTRGTPLVSVLGEARPSLCPGRPDDGALNDNCPVCGGATITTRLSVKFDRTYTVLRCRRCGLAFTVPRPTPEQLAGLYHDAYFRCGHGCNVSRTWDDLGAWAPATRSAPHTLLDIGAATGEFAAKAVADGWTVTACEPGDTARATAAAKGMHTITNLDDAAGRFGLITMFQVLEHVIDPMATLTRCRDLIDDDGLLAIELPQWRSGGRLIRRQRWTQLRPPEHINFFTRSSLRFALDRTGWALTYVSTPRPPARPYLRAAIRRRDARGTVRELGRLTLGLSGFGGSMLALARPV